VIDRDEQSSRVHLNGPLEFMVVDVEYLEKLRKRMVVERGETLYKWDSGMASQRRVGRYILCCEAESGNVLD
jgi:hypothetical protein